MNIFAHSVIGTEIANKLFYDKNTDKSLYFCDLISN